MSVPIRFREQAGKSIIQCSLGTSDRRQARLLANRKRDELFEQWGDLPARHVPTRNELEDAAVLIGYDLEREGIDADRKMLRGSGDAIWKGFVDFQRHELDRQQQATATGDLNGVRELADEAIAAFDFDLPTGSAGYDQFCDYLNTTRLAAHKISHRRIQGDVEAETDSQLVNRVRERAVATAKAGESIMDLFGRWSADCLAKREKGVDTVNQDRKVIRQFADFIGDDRAINSIRPIDVAEYRDALRNVPPKWVSNKALRGLTLRDAAVKARELELPQTAFTTVNKHLSTISPLYTWLGAQPAWAGLVNPCNGLFHRKVKGKNPRPPFSTEHLNKILSSPLFNGFLADGSEHKPGNVRADDWRYWIPLVALFSGARVGEITQLRLADVRQELGSWFIHIRHDDAQGLATKSRKSRPAAVHARLEEIGFIAFHKRQLERAGGDVTAPLFPELEKNGRGQIGAVPSRFWRDYLGAIGVKNGGDGYGSHSFRHTIADRLRVEVEILDDQIEVCLGHNQKTVTSGYGQLSQGTVSMLKAWIDGIRFDGVDFVPILRNRLEIGICAKTPIQGP